VADHGGDSVKVKNGNFSDATASWHFTAYCSRISDLLNRSSSSNGVYGCVSKAGGRYRRDHRNRLRQSISHRMLLQPRKRKLVDTPMDERPQCKFFKEGKCAKVSTPVSRNLFVPTFVQSGFLYLCFSVLVQPGPI